MGGLAGIVVAISVAWAKVRQTEVEAGLKQDMLNRAMSAADIQQVLDAGGRKSVWEKPDPLGPAEQVEVHRMELQAKLKKHMLENGMTAEQIEKVLKAG